MGTKNNHDLYEHKFGFIQIPNYFFGDTATQGVMAVCKPNTFKVVLVVIRQTIGWNKEKDIISWSQFMKLTGMSKGALEDAIPNALNNGFIDRELVGVNTYSYWIPPELKERYGIKPE